MINLYENSWLLYMKQHGEFVDDLNYYLEFTDQYTSLDLFAGFGRVSNF